VFLYSVGVICSAGGAVFFFFCFPRPSSVHARGNCALLKSAPVVCTN
jgi:hypothetical protein